jgi:regulator of PEP synthase PpsR (kinase-PPPase family)
MNETATLSTVIDAQVKAAVTSFCKKRGIKLRFLIEQALIEQLEDEMDLESYRLRRSEDTVSLEEILAKGKSRKR